MHRKDLLNGEVYKCKDLVSDHLLRQFGKCLWDIEGRTLRSRMNSVEKRL